MINQYEFKERGSPITEDTKKEILDQFDFSSFSLTSAPDNAQSEAPAPIQDQCFVYTGSNRRAQNRRKNLDRRHVMRFVGTERRVLHSQRNEDVGL